MSTYKPPQIIFRFRNPLALCAQAYDDAVAGRCQGSTPFKATVLWDALLKGVDIEIQPLSDMKPGQSYPLSVMSAPAGRDILAEEESPTKNAVTAPSSWNVTFSFPETYLDNNNMPATSTSTESAVSTATPTKCLCPDCPKSSGH